MTISDSARGGPAVPGPPLPPAYLVSAWVDLAEEELAGDLDQRRRRGVAAALRRATRHSGVASDPDSWEPPVGVCRYGQGCVALAVAGGFDQAGVERLRSLVTEVQRAANSELIIDCSRLAGPKPSLTRLLSRLRIQRLVAGARVELRSAPPELIAELGEHPTGERGPYPERSR